MKDLYGNEYVRPTVCSHLGCPPWICLLAEPSPILPLAPMPPPAPTLEERLADQGRVRNYRELGASFREYAARSTSPQIRDELNRKALDYELMAAGKFAGTSTEKVSAELRNAMQQAKSERLIVSAVVGLSCGIGFLYFTWGEFGGDVPKAILAPLFIGLLCTWSFKSLLNLVLGLPKMPRPASHGGSGSR